MLHRMTTTATAAARRAFTVVEFTVAMTLTLIVLLGSSVAIEHGMSALADGKARDGATELAYQVLAKQRVFGCGLGVGSGAAVNSTFDEARIAQLCGEELFRDFAGTPAPGTPVPAATDPVHDCTGDEEDRRSPDYQPGSCFEMTSRDPEHIRYRVYLRSIWRGGLTQGTGVATTGCWTGSSLAGTAPTGQPALLEREVVVRYQREGQWSRPVVATGTASRSPNSSVVVSGANMVPDGVPFVPAATGVVAGIVAAPAGTAVSQQVDLKVTLPGQPPVTLRRWTDDAGCVWFPFIPANATVSSSALGLAPTAMLNGAGTITNLGVKK